MTDVRTEIIGHATRRAAIKQLMIGRKLPSTMMFAGSAGIGKLLVAKEFCKTMVCERNAAARAGASGDQELHYGGCGTCKACHLFDAGNSPDCHFIQCLEKEESNMESLRSLLYSLNLNSFSGKSRITIFDNAEYLSTQAANLLLKTLEEPRPDTFFILVTASPSRLPATVLSRCQIWFFDSLKPDEVKSIIQRRMERDPDSPLSAMPADELAMLSDGSLNGLDSIAANHDLWLEFKDKLSLIFRGDVALATQFAGKLAKEKESLRVSIQLMRIHARQCMKRARDNDTAARWALFLTNLVSAERLILERNLAPANVLLTAFLNLTSNPKLSAFTRLSNSASLLDRISV